MPLKYRRSAQHTDFTAHHGKNQPGVTAWLDTPADQPFVGAASGQARREFADDGGKRDGHRRHHTRQVRPQPAPRQDRAGPEMRDCQHRSARWRVSRAHPKTFAIRQWAGLTKAFTPAFTPAFTGVLAGAAATAGALLCASKWAENASATGDKRLPRG